MGERGTNGLPSGSSAEGARYIVDNPSGGRVEYDWFVPKVRSKLDRTKKHQSIEDRSQLWGEN